MYVYIGLYIGHPKKDLFRMPRNGHDDMSRIGISSCPEMSAELAEMELASRYPKIYPAS